MEFNFKKLLDMQKKLDERIMTSKNVSYKETRVHKKIALLVEIGETANETRSFKYWSVKGPSKKNIIIEELVDCFHFILSFKIETKNDNYDFKKYKKEDLNSLWVKLFDQVANYNDDSEIDLIIDTLLTVAVTLDITGEEIFNGYVSKNKENHKRQDTGY